MKPLTQTVLWTAAGLYALVRGFQSIRNPSPDSSAFDPYGSFLFAGLFFFAAFDCYRKRGRTVVTTTVRLTRRESIGFKLLSVPTAVVGLVLLGLGCWLAWRGWIAVARWPRANAVLVSKDILSSKDIPNGGARLVFRYEVQGRQFTGQGFRWGSAKAVGSALESYRPGTIQQISYNPEDPQEIETVLSYNWELFRSSIFYAILGFTFIALGAGVYRWSYGWHGASPPSD